MRYELKRWIARMRDRRSLRARGVDPRRISIAVTSYNRAHLVGHAVERVVADPRVAEIVVSDDCSDAQDYARLRALAEEFGPKVRLYRNPRNYGGFKNKYEALSWCSCEWAVLLDSDNILPAAYLDRLYTMAQWRADTIYCPDYARPSFNFARFAGMVIDRGRAVELLSEQAFAPAFRTLLNTGNYFVPVPRFTALVAPFQDYPVRAACTIAAVYLWLTSGSRLQVVEGLEYFHRVHDDSYFMSENDASKRIVRRLCEALAADEGAGVFEAVRAGGDLPARRPGTACA